MQVRNGNGTYYRKRHGFKRPAIPRSPVKCLDCGRFIESHPDGRPCPGHRFTPFPKEGRHDDE